MWYLLGIVGIAGIFVFVAGRMYDRRMNDKRDRKHAEILSNVTLQEARRRTRGKI
jgi:hypothetical protein